MDDLCVINEDTLPDAAWKDSFDKLLDQKPVLREMNILKNNVRASFNINSSYENSNYDDSDNCFPGKESELIRMDSSPVSNNLQAQKIRLYKEANLRNLKWKSISTPVRISQTSNLFRCTLSPIGNCDYSNLNNATSERRTTHHLQSTKCHEILINETTRNVHCAENPSVTKGENKKFTINPVSPSSLAWKNIKSKCVGFDTKVISRTPTINIEPPTRSHIIHFQPGKWRKSLNIYKGNKYYEGRSIGGVQFPHNEHINKTNISVARTFAGQRKSILNHKSSSLNTDKNNFKHQLLRRCSQNKILSFEDVYTTYYLSSCYKIGEGAYGEVFLYTKPNGKGADRTVLKIIPIEGKELINGEIQKSFEQILQEVVISMELCALNDKHRPLGLSPGFVNIKRVNCVKGQYPVQLQKLWEEYDNRKQSENDHPECFSSDQQYIVLEMAFSGEDMERFAFRNAEQTFYALHQIIYALAVAEDIYQFEHRDLHWGNILFLKTNNKYVTYRLREEIFTLPTKGVQITIIDYTLSRITYDNCCYYNDLSNDNELFTAKGDYQFDIYRMMRDILNDKWEIYEPKTNIFWISYIISKMLDGVTYKNTRSKVHLQYMEKLKDLRSSILKYENCMDCARYLYSKL